MHYLFAASSFLVCQLLLAVSLVHAQDNSPKSLGLEAPDSTRYGFSYLGTSTNRETANFVFAATGNDLALDLLAFDIDFGAEVSVLLNGAFLAYLPTTTQDGTTPATLTFPADSLVAGDNTLSFVQLVPGWRWGITDLFLSECNRQCSQYTTPTLSLDQLDLDRYGFSYLGTSTNRETADFVFSATGNDLTLDLVAFDIDIGTEVSVLLNGAFLAFLPTTTQDGTTPATLTFPADSLVAGDNTLSFVQLVPGWRWGITDLFLSECNTQCSQDTTPTLSLDVLDFDRYGFSYLGTSNNLETADFVFAATGNDLTLDLTAFDIDIATEVSVLLNGNFLAYLPTTPQNGTGPASLVFPADSLVAGDNTLSFVNQVPGWRWGISDLFLSESKSGIYVENNQIVSSSAGPMILKGVNFEGSWRYSQGQNLDEVAKTGANSVRIVWNIWQSTENLSLVLNSAIDNGLLPILELHDSTIGHQLSSLIGDVAAFREVVSWWVSEDVKDVLLPLQDKMIVNIANETFRTDFGQEAFVDEYSNAIRQLRDAGYTTHLIIDGPDFGQDYVGGVARLRELQKVDSNISLGVHMYIAFLPEGSIEDLFAYMSVANVPWSIGEFSIQTPGCSGELDYRKIMSLANQHEIGYQAWSWGHGNSDCPQMDMTVPNGDFANLTDWGRAVADDLADSPKYLVPLMDTEQPSEPALDETLISIRARGHVGDENFRLVIGGTTVLTYSVQSSFQTFTFVSSVPGVRAADIRIDYTEVLKDNGQDQNLVIDYIEVDGTRYETESPTTYSTGTWLNGLITPGFGRGDTLHYNGYLQYDAFTQ